MPAIRDVSQGYHGTTTYKHVEAPMPAYAQGDLLLAFVSIDDSAGLSAQDIIVGRRAKYVYMNAVDYTAQAADSGPADWYMTLLDPALSDCVYFGLGEKFNQINVLNSTQGVATSNPVWTPEYSKGSSVWATLACTDGIGPNFKFVTTVHAQTTFTPPVDWAKDTVNGVLAYWIRWRCTTDGVYTTRPISTQAWVFPVLNGNNGWRQLFKYYAGTTPAPMSAVWKIAGATEYDSTFFYVTAETADVELIAIRDVQGSVDSGVAAMTVNCNATERTYIRATGSWVTDGFAVGMQIMPTGNTSVGNNRVRQIESIVTTTNADDTIIVTDGTNMVTEDGNNDERIIAWPFSSNITGGGAGSTFDGYTTSNNATYRSNLPQVTTTKDDCLIIWAAVPDAVSVPSIIEGPCQLIVGKDGAAHADGYAWGYQKTAGATPNNVYVTKMAALVTEMAVVAVNPPHGEATVRPAYGVSDGSTYINPLAGPAFGSDTLCDALLTTSFTGTINGRPVANGTYTSRADTGINSYHAMLGWAGAVTAGTWAGVRMIVASRNLASKNILLHTQPYLPVDIQTTDSAALLGTMGLAIGLCSSDGNFKVWHVAGAGVYGDTQRHQPIVIHSSASNGLLQTTGSFDPAAVTRLGFMNSGKVVAPNWLMASMWVLDTFVMVGGIAAEPMLLSHIVNCYAAGHERRSAIQQGSKQALFLGPVQIGDGTNFTYLNLDATAIEFPRQYNKDTKEVYYNSIDNVCGLKYCAKAGDTIIHKNSVVSSSSKYFWGVHSSFSTSVVPDFSGLSVIGAGIVTLLVGVTFSGITFTSCDEIPVVGAIITNCTFKNTTGTGALNVATSAEMATITNSTFSNNAYGIRLTKVTADTYAFAGITFSGNTKDVYVAATSGTVIINVSGGGGIPTYTSAGATVVINSVKTLTLTGLVAGSDIRILEAGTINVLDGTDDSGTTFDYVYNYGQYPHVDIVVLHLDYEYFRLDNYEPGSTSASIPIPLRGDRWYHNP